MELIEFLKVLKRRKAILIFVPLLTIIATYLIVRQMPDIYPSHTRIATGIVDRSQQLLHDNSWNHESKVNQEFSNMTQMIALNKMVDQVSYKLFKNDLTTQYPFRQKSDFVKELSGEEVKQLVALAEQKDQANEELALESPQEQKLLSALHSMGYDRNSIREALKSYRLNNSDFIEMTYESENPQLSAFVLNSLAQEFVNFYTNVVTANKRKAVIHLDSMLKIKHNALLVSMEELKNYKINNKVLDMEEQARNYYAQLADVSTRKGIAQKDVAAYSAALGGINGKFNRKDRQYLESQISDINQGIVRTKEELKAVNEAYINSGFDPRFKGKLDTLQRQLSNQIHAQSDEYTTSPLAAKNNLVEQKLNLEVSRDLASNSLAALDNEMARIKQGLESMVPNLATIQSLEANVEVANKEYMDILQKYNQASLEASYTLPLRQVEKALPEQAQPSKKMLLVGMSGALSLIMCVLVLFALFYFDKSVYSPAQLEASTSLRVLGSLNVMNGGINDIQYLWTQRYNDTSNQIYKNLLRSIRYEIENDINECKVIAVTSLASGVGKTFFTTSLAYAFAKINKKVLVIDGNFMNPDISTNVRTQNYLESCLSNRGEHTSGTASITILGNRGGDNSLLELSSHETIEKIFEQLKTVYDIILIETTAMESMNKAKAKEWILFSDKVITVFEAGKPVGAEVEGEIKYLKDLNGKFMGVVLNKVSAEETQVHDLPARKTSMKVKGLRLWTNIQNKLKNKKYKTAV